MRRSWRKSLKWTNGRRDDGKRNRRISLEYWSSYWHNRGGNFDRSGWDDKLDNWPEQRADSNYTGPECGCSFQSICINKHFDQHERSECDVEHWSGKRIGFTFLCSAGQPGH